MGLGAILHVTDSRNRTRIWAVDEASVEMRNSLTIECTLTEPFEPTPVTVDAGSRTAADEIVARIFDTVPRHVLDLLYVYLYDGYGIRIDNARQAIKKIPKT